MKKFLIFLLVFILLVCGGVFGAYNFLISAPSKESETVNIYVNEGSSYGSIGKLLEDNKLIRSELAYKVYLKFYEFFI